MTQNHVRTAQSCASDARVAVRELHAAIQQPNLELVIFFCSSLYDLNAVADEMNRLFVGVTAVGCTTAGEIGPAGYRNHSICGVSFSAGVCSAVIGRVGELQRFEIARGRRYAQSLLQQLESHAPAADSRNTFAFLLIDGMARREEAVARALQDGLGEIPLVGGSAGDDLELSRAWVFHQNQFHSDSAVLILVSTALPFKIFKTQHFVSETERLVVTEADASHRVVKEINGLPAAEEYARVVGVSVNDLNPQRFAASPVVVAVDGTDYVRSIQKANPDGSLTFYCAIDEGLVLRVVRGVDLQGNLERAFDNLRAAVGPLRVVIACDCVLRNLEITQSGLKESVGAVLHRNNVVGFSTYGEQFRGVHVNQTLTGIAFGSPSDG
ncbi:nitric oxide-sensing protein NosP [Noviherbaspirillum sp.]|uniref:nitric oxide-sensing protein NosP n=1 Tax=Noviherbaspirillum sp. TaxID=1926288 RepID=UPI0039C92A85